MYFDVFINGIKRATVGAEDLENLSISLSGGKDGVYLFSSGVVQQSGESYHLEWLNEELSGSDEVLIRASGQLHADEPMRRRRLRLGERSSADDRFCDFCKRPEADVGALIQAGDTPSICEQCVELCAEIVKGRQNEL